MAMAVEIKTIFIVCVMRLEIRLVAVVTRELYRRQNVGEGCILWHLLFRPKQHLTVVGTRCASVSATHSLTHSFASNLCVYHKYKRDKIQNSCSVPFGV